MIGRRARYLKKQPKEGLIPMQIPVANPMAGYPQPYATWAMLRNGGDAHGGASADESAGSSADESASPAYTVDVAA